MPVIVKPTDSEGGNGVLYANGKDELIEKLNISKYNPNELVTSMQNDKEIELENTIV